MLAEVKDLVRLLRRITVTVVGRPVLGMTSTRQWPMTFLVRPSSGSFCRGISGIQ